MAVANYHDTYHVFPPAYIADSTGKPMHSWRVLLLPFMEQHELYSAYDFDEPWDGPNNRKLLARRPSSYAFPDRQSEQGVATNYVAVVGHETVWTHDKSLSMDQIADGPSQTILLVENYGGDIPWLEPRDLDFSTMSMDLRNETANGISSRYAPPAVVSVAGMVHTLSAGVSPGTLRALLTANGGETVVMDADVKEIPDGRDRPLKPR